MKKKTIGICLAFDDLYTGRGVGDLIIPLDGGILRFQSTYEEMVELAAEENLLVSTAGYGKVDPSVPRQEQPVSLADQLKRYIREYHPKLEEMLLAKPIAWSTENEIRVGIKEVITSGFCSAEERVHLVIASHPWHLRRIRMYAYLHKPKEWVLHLVPVRHHFPAYSYVHEVGAIMRDLPRVLFHQLFQLRSLVPS